MRIDKISSIISAARNLNRRQSMLLKLIIFSILYGLVPINWIDLGTSVPNFVTNIPAYHIWFLLILMAPFGLIMVFRGIREWKLALSMAMLSSLMNDLGYYFIGDLFFGKHVPLLPWYGNQLGLRWNEILYTFQGGFFTISVTSLIMGMSIYIRAIIVILVVYRWLKTVEK